MKLGMCSSSSTFWWAVLAETYPEYMVQISLYDRELHKMDLVEHPNAGIFTMMDRDGRPLPPERVGWEDSMVDETLEKLRQVVETVERGEIPERPYGPNSLKCRYCNYNLLCRGPQDEIVEQVRERSNGYEIKKTWSTDDPDIVGAAHRWLEPKSRMDDAKDTPQKASDDAGKADVVAGIVVAGYFQPRNPPAFGVKPSSPGSPEHSEPRGKQPVRRASPSGETAPDNRPPALVFKTTVFHSESQNRPVGVIPGENLH